MKKILLLIALVLTACQAHQSPTPHKTPSKPVSTQSDVLIVFFDPSKHAQIMQAINTLKGELIYDYQSFNGMAVRFDNAKLAQQTLLATDGVLSARFDQVMELH